jgi:hypothetical protein
MVQDCPACLLAGSSVCLLVCPQYFAHHGVEAHLLALPTCEQNKELELVTTIADALEDFKINRWGQHVDQQQCQQCRPNRHQHVHSAVERRQ